jgi:hypothetical protein
MGMAEAGVGADSAPGAGTHVGVGTPATGPKGMAGVIGAPLGVAPTGSSELCGLFSPGS